MKPLKVLAILLIASACALGWYWHVSQNRANSAGSADVAPLIDFPFLDLAVANQPGASISKVTFPPELENLDNHRVSIIGFMAPYEEIDNMRHFLLLPSYTGCYFCSPPSFTQVLLVEQSAAQEGKLPYINDPILVTGTLKLWTKDSQHPAHLAKFVYALDDAHVSVYRGADAPVRVQAPQHNGSHNATFGKLSLPSPSAAPTPPPSAPPPPSPGDPHFRPDSLIEPVAKLRGLALRTPIHFQKGNSDEIAGRLSQAISALRSRGQWRARAKAYQALGLADGPFDMPRALADIALRHTPGFYEASTQTIWYYEGLPLSKPEIRLELVKMITQALLAQNEVPLLPPTLSDDATLAALAIRLGDIQNTARLFDEQQHLLGNGPRTLTGMPLIGAKAPPLFRTIADSLYESGPAYVAHASTGSLADSMKVMYEHPPVSTRALLHANSPSSGDTPAWANESGAELQGSKPLLEGVLGEATLAAWLSRGSIGHDLAHGWKADHFTVWENASGGFSWKIQTAWDDEASATAFFKAATALPELSETNTTQVQRTPDHYQAMISGRPWRAVLDAAKREVMVISADSEATATDLATAK